MEFDAFDKQFNSETTFYFETFARGSVTQEELNNIAIGRVGFCVLNERWEQREDGDYRIILKAKTYPVAYQIMTATKSQKKEATRYKE